ncbi:MAG TPA: hypothetical protein VGB77_15850 [Abditibacteriaceae bacterium]
MPITPLPLHLWEPAKEKSSQPRIGVVRRALHDKADKRTAIT